MASPNVPPDPPPSISAAELRRRLIGSTPPPVAGATTTPNPDDEEPAVPENGVATWASGSQDLLARLRMPTKPGAGSGVRQTPPPADPPATGQRPSVNRRTPPPSRAPLDPSSAIAGALNQLAGVPEGSGRHLLDDSPMAEIQRLRAENRELRTLLDEMKHLLQDASEIEQSFTAKEKEFAEALEAKEAQIEELSTHLGAIEEQIAKGELAPPPPIPKTRTELEEWADELEKESNKLTQDRKRLEDERKQLRDDEEGLENQMREMEVSMARERAMLARQETELKRLSAEIQHELDLMQRGDAGLREQMARFQRRANEVMNKPGANGRR